MPLSTAAHRVVAPLRRRSRRQVVSVSAVVVVILAATTWWVTGRADSAEAQSTVVTVATGTYQTTVSGSGTIEPAQQADLDFEVSGRVTSVDVKAGDTVTKGEVLATLDTVSLDAALASAEAQLEAAETTAADDGSETTTQRVSNDAAVASAEADLDQAKDDAAAAKLRSTITGTVAAVDVAVGDQAGSSSSGSSSSATGGAAPTATAAGGTTTTESTSTAAVTVVSPQKFTVDVDVAADDITQVTKGLQVEVTPNGATEAIFGTVSDVGLVAETSSSGTATFPVTVKITGAQKDLYAGTTADVSIVVKQVQDVLTVPSQALTTSGSTTYVTLVDGSSTKKTAVTVGETYGLSTEITKGVKAGDQVQVTAAPTTRSGAGATGGGQRGEGGFPGGGAGFPGGGAPPAGFSGGGAQ